MMELEECMNGIEEKQMQINSTLIIPDGTMKKLTDVSKLHGLEWEHRVELKAGIEIL